MSGWRSRARQGHKQTDRGGRCLHQPVKKHQPVRQRRFRRDRRCVLTWLGSEGAELLSADRLLANWITSNSCSVQAVPAVPAVPVSR